MPDLTPLEKELLEYRERMASSVRGYSDAGPSSTRRDTFFVLRSFLDDLDELIARAECRQEDSLINHSGRF